MKDRLITEKCTNIPINKDENNRKAKCWTPDRPSFRDAAAGIITNLRHHDQPSIAPARIHKTNRRSCRHYADVNGFKRMKETDRPDHGGYRCTRSHNDGTRIHPRLDKAQVSGLWAAEDLSGGCPTQSDASQCHSCISLVARLSFVSSSTRV